MTITMLMEQTYQAALRTLDKKIRETFAEESVFSIAISIMAEMNIKFLDIRLQKEVCASFLLYNGVR